MTTFQKLERIRQLDPRAAVIQSSNQFTLKTTLRAKTDCMETTNPTETIGLSSDAVIDAWWNKYVENRLIWEAVLRNNQTVIFDSASDKWIPVKLNTDEIDDLLDSEVVLTEEPVNQNVYDHYKSPEEDAEPLIEALPEQPQVAVDQYADLKRTAKVVVPLILPVMQWSKMFRDYGKN